MTKESVVKFDKAMQNGFAEKARPKIVNTAADAFLFQCPACGNAHFRHAGYVKSLMPFVRADGSQNVQSENYSVNVCVKCRKSYTFIAEQMQDISALIDVEAWEKAEKELHKATGPGGDC